jgi:hypothetical protein
VAESDDMFVLSRADVDAIRQLIKWQRNFRGTGVKNGPQGATLSQTPGRLQVPESSPDETVTVRIPAGTSGNRVGQAWYKGFIVVVPTGAATTSNDATEGTAGTSSTTEVSILNLNEIDGASQTGHDLTHTDNTDQLTFVGRITGQVDEEGRPVIHVNAVWVESCE